MLLVFLLAAGVLIVMPWPAVLFIVARSVEPWTPGDARQVQSGA